MSSGASTMKEIKDAMEAIHLVNECLEVAILHCVSNYPTKIKEINLNCMQSIKKEFGVPVGFSDHTFGISASILAVALGAELIEKHFTLDKTLDGPDHALSTNPEELKDLVSGIKVAFEGRGNYDKIPVESKNLIAQIRRSIFVNKDLKKGTILSQDMLSITRPVIGIEPKYYDDIIGKKLKYPISKNQPLKWSDIDDNK